MDLLVTTPKSEIAISKQEGEIVEQEGGYWFRTFKFHPLVQVGDKIYFVESGCIKGYGIIFEVAETDGERCDVTNRTWRGNWVVKYNHWHWLNSPVPFKGFQGIRYIPRLVSLQRKLGGL